MTEDFLHYLWKFQLWTNCLYTTDNHFIEVLNTGIYNHDAGPDFLHAKIRINDTIWAGHVEIHDKASDWYAHHHNTNAAYGNVILHVVINADCDVFDNKGCRLNCCCIKNKFNDADYQHYMKWKNNMDFVACKQAIKNVAAIQISAMVDRICVESLEEKVDEILIDLAYNNRSWEETFYQHLLKCFGLKVNAHSFLLIAKHLPLKLLYKHRNNLFQLEAMLLGQSNLLSGKNIDNYSISLAQEYSFLKNKYKLLSIPERSINFLRLRPSSFPTIRLALFAQLINKHETLFSLILNKNSISSIRDFFDVSTSGYWDSHYFLNRSSITMKKSLGNSAIDLIIINAIVPFLFAYGKLRGLPQLSESAITLLNELSAENNIITRGWNLCGVKPDNAFESQGLIHLKKKYCDRKRCLECGIGGSVIKLRVKSDELFNKN